MSELRTEKETPEEKSNLTGFIVFWGGQLFSILGSNVIQFVLIWWITIETENPIFLSLATLVGFIPRIILLPIAGVFVDRWNRKALISTVDFLQATATVVLLFLFKFDKVTIWVLFLFLTIRGAAQAFQTPAVTSLLPIMVPKKHFSRVNSVQNLLNNVIRLIGPMFAVLLLAFFSIDNVLWIDPITYVISVIPLLLIKIPKVDRKKSPVKKKSFRKDFKEGISFMKEKKGLFAMMFSFAATNFFILPLFVLINLFIYKNHGGTETNLAFVLAFNQAGTIAGTVLFIIWKGFKRKIHGAVIGIVGIFTGCLIAGLAPIGMFWFMGVGLLITGFFSAMANISSQTIWQEVVPKELMGRVFSVRYTVAQIISPLSMVLSGLIAAKVNIQIVVIVSAILGIVSFLSIFIFSNMRHVEDQEEHMLELKEIKVEETDSAAKGVETISSP